MALCTGEGCLCHLGHSAGVGVALGESGVAQGGQGYVWEQG